MGTKQNKESRTGSYPGSTTGSAMQPVSKLVGRTKGLSEEQFTTRFTKMVSKELLTDFIAL